MILDLSFSFAVLLLIFTIGGITLKLADFYGERKKGYLSFIFAGFAAVCLGIILSISPTSAAIFFGIMIGVTVAGKLDNPNMVFGLFLTIGLAFLFGFQLPDIPLLILITLAALLDEIVHDTHILNGFLFRFFSYRMILKMMIVLLTVSTWIHYSLALEFFCFDISYDLTNLWIRQKIK
jgi:hypothetical protein